MTGMREPAPGAGEAHVWHAPLDPTAPALEALAAWLSPAERERAGRFKFERGRRRHVTAHAFLRGLLGGYLGCAPEAVALEAGAGGKPALASPETLRFNLAHSEEIAMVVIAGDRDVGVDVERIRPLRSGPGLARRVLSAGELEDLGSEPDQTDLLACWTRKEAVLKALGAGLRRDPATVEVGARGTALVTLSGNGAAGGQWSVVSLAPVPGYVAAVAARGPALAVREAAWEWERP